MQKLFLIFQAITFLFVYFLGRKHGADKARLAATQKVVEEESKTIDYLTEHKSIEDKIREGIEEDKNNIPNDWDHADGAELH